MYSIYSKVGDYRVCLHEDTVADETVKVLDPVLTLEDNAAGSLEFRLAPNNIGYDTHTLTNTLITGINDLSSRDITNDMASYSDLILASERYLIDKGASKISLSLTPLFGDVDIIDNLAQGSIDRETGDVVLSNPYYCYTRDPIEILDDIEVFKPKVSIEKHNYDLSGKVKQGQIQGSTIGPSDIYVYTEKTEVEEYDGYLRVRIKTNYKDESQLQFAITGYDENGEVRLSSAFFDLIDSINHAFNFIHQGLNPTVVRTFSLCFRRQDRSELSADEITEVQLIDESRFVYDVFVYDENDNFIKAIGSRDVSESAELNVTGQKYYRVVFSSEFEHARFLYLSEIEDAIIISQSNTRYMAFFYDSKHSKIEASKWTIPGSSVDIPSEAHYVDFHVKKTSDEPISPADITDVAFYQRSITTQTTSKTVDLVGRLTSTITVYRDTLHKVSSNEKQRDIITFESQEANTKVLKSLAISISSLGSGFNSVSVEAYSSTLVALEWGVELYDNNMKLLESHRWTPNLERVTFNTTEASYAIVLLRYISKVDIAPSEISSAVVKFLTVTETITKDEIWEGRVLTEENDFWNTRQIYCEGELSYLNDTCQPSKIYEETTIYNFLKSVLDVHNSKVAEDKRFYIGNIWLSGQGDFYRKTTQYEKTLEILNNLIEEFGGHIRLRKKDGVRYLDWYEDYPNVNEQVIEFGKNLLEFDRTWDMSEMCTALLPTGTMLQEGGSTAVGEELELNLGAGPTYGQLLYLDKNTKEVHILVEPGLGGYKTAVAVVEPGKNYYFSGRLHGGYVAYTIKSNPDGSGDYYDGGTKTAGTEGEVGFVDFIDQKIEIPPGAHSVVMCSFGDDIPLSLKTEVEAVEGLDEYLTIENVNDDVDSSGSWHVKGSPYITNPETLSIYGWIEKQISFEDLEDEKALYDAAKLYLKNGQFDEMTLELSAIDMNTLGVRAENIELLDQVRVVSIPHGLDKYFPVTKLEIPLSNPAEQKFTLGSNPTQSLTDVNNSINEDLMRQIAAVPSLSQTLRDAKANAADMINNATNGYIIFVMDEDGRPKELLISDRQDYRDPNAKVWRWNMGGLAYSNKGYNLTEFNTNVAITADGAIVANMITAGILRGIQIQGCRFETIGDEGEVLVKKNASSGYYVKLKAGEIIGGYYENGEQHDISSISCNVEIAQPDGSMKRGWRILSNEVCIIETPDLGVGRWDGQGALTTYNGSFEVYDKKLEIINGWIVGVSDTQRPDTGS